MAQPNFFERMAEKYAARDPKFNPMDWSWYQAYDWDLAHANNEELWAREVDMERIWQATELAEADEFVAALEIWRELAASGSVWSMIQIGRCYEYGRSVAKDPAEAESWYKQAFDCGSQHAMLKCAEAAASRNDYSRCETILQPGVAQDWTPAIFWSAWYQYKNSNSKETYRTIRPLLRKTAQRGHPAAQMIYAWFMARGKFGWWLRPLGSYYRLRWAITVANRDRNSVSSRDDAELPNA